jgi:inosine-uridine nucleoside N-ribohydrolase
MKKNNGAKSVLFMGQVKKDGGTLIADSEAYNFRCDPYASQACFQYQDRTPFALVGKTMAYRVPMTFEDIDIIGALKNPVAKFIKDHAYMFHEYFKKNTPDLFERIYKNSPNISFCYDPLCMLAVSNPDLYIFEKFGKHRIAVDIKAEEAKKILMDMLKAGLA